MILLARSGVLVDTLLELRESPLVCLFLPKISLASASFFFLWRSKVRVVSWGVCVGVVICKTRLTLTGLDDCIETNDPLRVGHDLLWY